MKMISQEILNSVGELKDAQKWINEATFGLNHVEDFIAELSPGSNVLEVGSGSGILLSHLKNKFKNINFTGIEPFGNEFLLLKKYHNELKNIEGDIRYIKYESFDNEIKYDYIFLINVFEHLPDWKHFIKFLTRKLNKNGKCTILCPNYSFPFETHFNLPIIFNKKITYMIFGKTIKKKEKYNDIEGMWDSLNFVKYSHVKKFCISAGLKFKSCNDVSIKLIKRLKTDTEFKKRNKLLGFFGNLLSYIGLLKLLEFNFMRYLDPYMKLIITKE